MVTKLTFKGEKPAKKKSHKHHKYPHHKHTPQESREPQTWVSASNGKDLKGPAVLCFSDNVDPNIVCCICSDPQGRLYVSNNVDILDTPNDPNMQYDSNPASTTNAKLHSVEPNDVQQVFVLNPLAFTENVKNSDNENLSTKVSIKAYTGKYLTIEKHGLADALSIAIGPYQMFMPTLCSESTGRWIITGDGNGTYLSVEGDSTKGYTVRGDATDRKEATEFVIRIQSQNKFEAKPASTLLNSQHISSRELEARVGGALSHDEKKRLKLAYKEGHLNEALLDLRQKSKTDTRC